MNVHPRIDRRATGLVTGLVIALSAAIFGLDLLTPYGWADWLFYLLPLILLAPMLTPQSLFRLAAAYTVLMVLGLLWSPAGDVPLSLAVFNRALGALVMWVATFLLAQRMRAAHQLAVQNAALAAAGNAITITDRDARIIWVNPAFTQLTGYPSHEVIGRNPRLLKAGVQEPSFYEHLWRTISGGQKWSGEMLNRRKDGTRYTQELTITPVLQDGEITHFVAIHQDITDRKRAEAAHQEEARIAGGLARVGAELIAALNTPLLLDRLCRVTVEILGCDSSYTLTPENDVFKPIATFGGTPEEQEVAQVMKVPRAMMSALLSRLESDEVAQVGTIPLDLLSRAQQLHFGVPLTLCMALRRGRELIGLQVAVSRNRRARYTETEHRIARGIAHLASLALDHARVVNELEAASRIKSEFVATMSHELRTPLNIIIGYIDLLLEGEFGTLLPEQVETTQKIQATSQELLKLITATLDLGGLESGRVPLAITDVDLAEVIDEVDGQTRGLQERSGLSFLWRVPANLHIRTDATKLTLVLKNLIENAIKFTEKGTVKLEACARADGVEIAVADTGIGIAPGALPIIFDAFRQADMSTTRPYGGVGLGLYIVRSQLDLLGGTIRVDTEVGGGSTFRVWLPTSPDTIRRDSASGRPLLSA